MILNAMFYYFFIIFCVLLPFQFALNPTAGIDLAIVRIIVPFLFLMWLFLELKNNQLLLKKGATTYFFLTFLVFATISVYFSQNIAWSLRKLIFLFSLAPIYFISVSVLSTKHRQRLAIVALVAGATAAAFFGIIQFIAQFVFSIDDVYSFLASNIAPFFLGKSFSQAVLAHPSWLVNSGGVTYMRATAMFPDPHMFSYYLGLMIPWSIALWKTSSCHKKLFFFSTFLLVTANILSFTRGGYVALIASALIILPLVSRGTVKKLILGILGLLFLLMIAPHNPVSGRLVSSFDTKEGSNQARIANWRQALPIIAAHPFGVGIGMYPLSIKPTADYREPIYAHNLYLDISAELGIPAVVIFILLLFTAFRNFWKAAKKEPFFIAGVASITLFSVHSLVESPLYSVHIFPLILITIGLSTCLQNYEKSAVSH